MNVADIMSKDVVSVDPETNVSKVADILFANRFHGMPITENGKLVGVVTEDDFFLKNYDEIYLPSYLHFLEENKSAENLPSEIKDKIERLLGIKVKEIMTTDCKAVNPDTNLIELMSLIKSTKFTTFPVIDTENNLVGIVTLSDVLGTVRRGSVMMKKAFEGKFKSTEAEELAKQLDYLWKEKLAIVSRKNIQIWKGAFFALVAFVIILAIFLIF